MLINGPDFRISPEKVAEFRKTAISIESDLWTSEKAHAFCTQYLSNYLGAYQWLLHKAKAEENIDLKEKVDIQYRLENSKFSRKIIYQDKEGVKETIGLVYN